MKHISKQIFVPLFLIVYSLIFIIHIWKAFGMSREGEIYLQLVSYTLLCCFGVYLFKNDIIRGMKEIRQHFFKSLLILVLSFLFEFLLSNLSSFFAYIVLTNTSSQNDLFVSEVVTLAPYWVIVLTLGIFGPIVEEFIFRYILIKWGKSYFPISLVIITQALLFGLIHIKSFEVSELVSNLPNIVSGLAYGIIYYKTNNIVYSSTLHVFNNATIFLLLF